MRLSDKAAASGLDLDAPGLSRPTLGLVPHGHVSRVYNQHSRVRNAQGGFDDRPVPTDAFDFPAIADLVALNNFIAAALAAFASAGFAASPRCGRVLLTGHSGGGAALDALFRSFAGQPVKNNGVHYFDATYGNPGSQSNPHPLIRPSGWLDTVLARDSGALTRVADAAARVRYMQSDGAGLRILFIEGSGTAPLAHAADDFVRNRLNTLVADQGLRQFLRRYYRAQRVARPAAIGHSDIPHAFGGRLLADPADDLGADAIDLAAAAPARSHGVDLPARAADAEESLAWSPVTALNAIPGGRFPQRPADAASGSAFIRDILNLRGVDRENRIRDELTRGNFPDFLRGFQPVAMSEGGHRATIFVMRDYLAVGSDNDFVRMPMDAITAQSVADAFECMLPTAKMVEAIYQASPNRLPALPRDYWRRAPGRQTSTEAYAEHSAAIDAQMRGRALAPGSFVAGHKKDVVIAHTYSFRDRQGTLQPRLAFYGWYDQQGRPIQDQNGRRGFPDFAHEPSYADYSHGVRLVSRTMEIDGQFRPVAEILADPTLNSLLSAEGPITAPRITVNRSSAAASAHAADSPGRMFSGPSSPRVDALGYGEQIDGQIQASVETLLAAFMGVPARVGGTELRVHVPYFINAHNVNCAAPQGPTQARLCAALRNRANAARDLRELVQHPRFAHARVGKPTPEEIRELLQLALDGGMVQRDLRLTSAPTTTDLRNFLIKFGIGIDCSGFVSQTLNRILLDIAGGHAPQLDLRGTGAAALRGNSRSFAIVGDPTDLRPGDTMWSQSPAPPEGRGGMHIRILSRVGTRAGHIEFETAESKAGAGSPGHVGPTAGYWRLEGDARGLARTGQPGFQNWRLLTATSPGASDNEWRPSAVRHVFSHYLPLSRLLQERGVQAARINLAS
jgi:hypothetical protein